MFAFPLDMTWNSWATSSLTPARVGRAVCSSFPFSDVQLPGSPFLRESACILSSSTLMCFLLVPIVLRELVVTVVCSPENFDSFSGVAHANSITVERLPRFVFAIHISSIFAEFWSLVETWLFESGALCLLAPRLTRKMYQTVLFHHDLAKKEQGTNVCE